MIIYQIYRLGRRCQRLMLSGLLVVTCLICMPSVGAQTRKSGALHRSPNAVRWGSIDDALRHAIETAPNADQWPDQDYALLLDVADVTVKPDGTVISRFRQTYKLFTARARNMAEVNLPYNSSYQNLHVVSARTVQEDGKVLELSKSEIRPTGKYSDELLYDDVQGVGFSLPGIQNNCIIDYSWEEVSRPLVMPGQFWFSWIFSGPSPVECSRLTLHYPTKSPLHVTLRNIQEPQPSESTTVTGNVRTTVWESKKQHPLKIEPLMPDWMDVAPRLEITSLATWQDVASWYWNLQSSQTSISPPMKATVSQLITGKTTEEEKARAIYRWVAQSVRYVGLEFGLSAFRPHRAAEVYANLYGDCKDKATLLIAMLREAGIPASPALLHTDMCSLLDKSLPAPDAFDHCIACATVDGNEVWLDATAENCDYGDIPDSDRGAQALVVRDGVGLQKTIPDFAQSENSQDTSMHVTLNEDGSAVIVGDFIWRGRFRQEVQDLLSSTTSKQKQALLAQLANQLCPGAALQKVACSENRQGIPSMTLHVECTVQHWARRVGDLLLLPASWPVSTPIVDEITEESRAWPIVLGKPVSNHARVVVKLPANTIVEAVPDEIKKQGPLQEFERHYQHAKQSSDITIEQNYQSFTGTIPPSKYPELRAYDADLQACSGDRIVLHIGH